MTDKLNGSADPAALAELARADPAMATLVHVPQPSAREPNIRWTQRDLDETLQHIFKYQEQMLPVIGRFVQDRIDLATARLLARIEELEKGGISYHGVHQRAQAYKRGALVTHDGSIFVAVTDAAVGEMPGQSAAWQCAVKHGRDAPERRLPTKGGARW